MTRSCSFLYVFPLKVVDSFKSFMSFAAVISNCLSSGLEVCEQLASIF